MGKIPDSVEPDIPDIWTWTTLGDLCNEVRYGYTAKASKSAVGPKLLRITDITGGEIDWEGVPNCTIDEDRKPKYLLKEGDIVIARTGSVGSSYLIKGDIPETVFASYLIRIRLNDKIKPHFVKHFLDSTRFWKQIHQVKRGIGRPNVNARMLKEIRIPLPSMEEQHRIIESLNRIRDSLRTSRQETSRIPDLTRRLRMAILSKAFREELIRDEEVFTGRNLGDVVERFQNGTGRRRDGKGLKTPILRLANVKNGEISQTDIREYSMPDDEIEKYRLNKDDLLLVRVNGSRNLVARPTIFDREDTFTFCDHFIRCTVNKSLILPQFLSYQLESHSCRTFIEYNMVSSAGQNTISQRVLEKMPLKLPSLDIQKHIVNYIGKSLEMLSILNHTSEEAILSFDRLESSILLQAFKGKLTHTNTDVIDITQNPTQTALDEFD